MSKTMLVKTIVRSVVGVSTSFTVANALRNNVPTESKAQKAQLAIGSVAVGAVASEATGNYTDRLIDDLAAAFQSAKTTA